MKRVFAGAVNDLLFCIVAKFAEEYNVQEETVGKK